MVGRGVYLLDFNIFWVKVVAFNMEWYGAGIC